MKRGRKPLGEILTDEQKAYIKEYYPCTPNAGMAEKLGICKDSLQKYASKNGISKSRYYLNGIRHAAGSKAAHRNLFRKGHRPFRLSSEAETKRREKISEGLRAAFRRARIRDAAGLPPLNRLKIHREPRFVTRLRKNLRDRGYMLDEEKRVARYDEDTKRSRVLERRKRWYAFESVYKRPEM